jgi:hypothetical protein
LTTAAVIAPARSDATKAAVSAPSASVGRRLSSVLCSSTRVTPRSPRFLRHRAELRGTPLRIVPTRANLQPAFGCYLPDPRAAIARPYGLFVLTLEGDAVSAVTWFSDTGVFRHFGLPRTLPSP